MAETTQRSANEHGGSVSSATQHSDRGGAAGAWLADQPAVAISHPLLLLLALAQVDLGVGASAAFAVLAVCTAQDLDT